MWKVDPDRHAVTVLVLDGAAYGERGSSPLTGLERQQLEAALDWPD